MMNTTLRQAIDPVKAKAYQSECIAKLASQVTEQNVQVFESIRQVAVVGAGAMGRCIAIAFARIGKQVVVVDSFAESLQQGERFIRGYFKGQVQKNKLTEEAAEELQQAFSFSEELAAVAGSQLVVEAVPEELSLKQQVMQAIAGHVDAECILATNTSTLDLDKIAEVVPAPERVIGTHFFIPAHVTRLLEIIPAKQTSVEVVGVTKAMALAMKKVFVIAGNCDGFIGNRLFDRFHQEAMYLLEEGATPEQVDDVLESWGMAIGPFRALDMVGNDIPWQVRCQRKEKNPDIIQPTIGDRLCEQGRYGQKTNAGWYRYEPGSREALSDPSINEFMQSVSNELGNERREISNDEILGRCILALVNEGCAIVREGFAWKRSDIDLAYVNGYGFPASVGGPMYLAKELGIDDVVEEMNGYKAFASQGAVLWEPDLLLVN